MAEPEPANFTVVGAGLGGSLMATYLARAGNQVQVYEGRPDPRLQGADRGRSINLAISTRGLHALAQVGLVEEILEMATPMRGRMIHSLQGRLAFQPYGTSKHQVINSVSRAGLNLALIKAAGGYDNVELHFGRRCSAVDLETAEITVQDRGDRTTSSAAADVVVGADGAFSVVRRQMQRMDRFDYRQSYLEHGYKELVIPPAADGGFAMEPHALHIWPRGGFMMIALPNLDRSFTCTLFWPFTGPNSFAALQTADDVQRFFQRNFPDAVPLMPELADDYFGNPVGSLVTVRCRPWYYRDRGILIGDACHAVVPFYGQGANAAFEDCFLLSQSLERHKTDRELAFHDFQSGRRRHAEILADLAIANFLEMRDHTASRLFRFRKALERGLHRVVPHWFVPLYSMVTFSRLPYGQALQKSRRQWRWVGVAAAGLLAAGLWTAFLLIF